ncbi:hypothetical protein [Aliterella atlantica]|nr:hypothetical protein [Aliterella atlantica]
MNSLNFSSCKCSDLEKFGLYKYGHFLQLCLRAELLMRSPTGQIKE